MSDSEIQFKPLTEGLGFHPFSNGLPYTPATPKRDFSRGTGAVAAGKPTFIFPQPAAAPVAAQAPALEAEAPVLKILGWDYVGRRFFAYIMDSAINLTLGLAALIASLWPSLDVFASTNAILVTGAFLLFFNWALIAAQEVAFGSSIGKRVFGLHLDGGPLMLLFRAILFVPGVLLFGLGICWAALDSDRRGFHDILTGIQPEEY